MNKVQLIGHLTKDVTIRYSKNGSTLGDTSIAVNNRRDQTTMFIDLLFFGRLAEIANQYLKRGAQIGISGRLDLDQWEKDGQKRQKHKIIVDELEMLGKKDQLTQNTQNTQQFSKEDFEISEEEIPF